MPRCGFAAGCRQPSPCGRAWMAHSHAAGPARPSRACREPRLLRPAAVPPKISRCWGGGMPSFSSTLSLMREIVSSLSMSISISLPVSVFTLICHRAEARSAYRASPKLGSAARHARSWLEKGGWTICAVLSQRPAQARRTLQAAGIFSDSGHRARPALGLGEQRRACPRASEWLMASVCRPWPPPRVWQRQGRGRVREPEGAEQSRACQRRAPRVALSRCRRKWRGRGARHGPRMPRLGCSRSAAGTWMAVRNSAELRAQACVV